MRGDYEVREMRWGLDSTQLGSVRRRGSPHARSSTQGVGGWAGDLRNSDGSGLPGSSGSRLHAVRGPPTSKVHRWRTASGPRHSRRRGSHWLVVERTCEIVPVCFPLLLIKVVGPDRRPPFMVQTHSHVADSGEKSCGTLIHRFVRRLQKQGHSTTCDPIDVNSTTTFFALQGDRGHP